MYIIYTYAHTHTPPPPPPAGPTATVVCLSSVFRARGSRVKPAGPIPPPRITGRPVYVRRRVATPPPAQPPHCTVDDAAPPLPLTRTRIVAPDTPGGLIGFYSRGMLRFSRTAAPRHRRRRSRVRRHRAPSTPRAVVVAAAAADGLYASLPPPHRRSPRCRR